MKSDNPDPINEKDIERMARDVGTPLPPGFLQELLEKAKEITPKAKTPAVKPKTPEITHEDED